MALAHRGCVAPRRARSDTGAPHARRLPALTHGAEPSARVRVQISLRTTQSWSAPCWSTRPTSECARMLSVLLRIAWRDSNGRPLSKHAGVSAGAPLVDETRSARSEWLPVAHHTVTECLSRGAPSTCAPALHLKFTLISPRRCAAPRTARSWSSPRGRALTPPRPGSLRYFPPAFLLKSCTIFRNSSYETCPSPSWSTILMSSSTCTPCLCSGLAAKPVALQISALISLCKHDSQTLKHYTRCLRGL